MEAAEAGVLIAVGVRDVVLKLKKEVSKGFSRYEVELANAERGAGHTSFAWAHLAFMLLRGFCW